MIEFVFKAIVIGAFCAGLATCFEDGMILSGMRKWLNDHIKNKWILKPICNCVFCMPSVWGSMVYWLLSFAIGLSIQSVLLYPVCIVCSVFLSGLFYGILQKHNQYL